MSSSSRLNDVWKALVIVAAIAALGCKEKSKLDRGPGSSPATGSAAATPQPAGETKAQPAAEADARAFCEKTMQKLLACFDDTTFWDNFSTTWFAKYPDTSGNPDAKKAWIGMRKDDIVGLKKDGQLEQNCDVMVRHNRLPTAADMQPVTAAMAKSCGDFGTAMGFLLFHTGAFHQPR